MPNRIGAFPLSRAIDASREGRVLRRCIVAMIRDEVAEIVAAVDDVASGRVAERAGATLVCAARNRQLLHGVPIAAAVHSLVTSDVHDASRGRDGV